MTLKECLVQFCDIKVEIKDLQKKIEKLELRNKEIISDSVETTTKTFPVIMTHYKIFGNDQKILNKLEHLKSLLEDRLNKQMDLYIKIEEFINKMPTSRLRMIFEYRYINQYSWAKVSRLIGGDTTEDSIRKEHDRYLKKLEKNKVCPFCPEKL